MSKPSGKGPLKSLGRVWGKIVALKKLLGMLPLQRKRSHLVPKLLTTLGRKLGMGEKRVEPIVPLRGLIDLGFVIKWSAHGCEIKHPSRGTIQCWLRHGCPVVSEKHALGLIHDIESMELAIPSETSETVFFESAHEWWSQRFPNVPKRIWNYMEGQGVETPGTTCMPVKHLRNGVLVGQLMSK